MRFHGHTIHNAVAGIPTLSRTGAVQQHLDAEMDTASHSPIPTARETLLQREQGKGGWHHPTACVWLPGPAEFVRIKADVSVACVKLPLPKPACFPTLGAD